MDPKSPKHLVDTITDFLSGFDGIIFAYLYGSIASEGEGNDVDLAVYIKENENPFQVSADLKIDLHRQTGIAPDTFDVRVINDLNEHGDIFGLLYLKNVLEEGQVLVDRAPDVRSDFLERYGSQYRECEGLIQEVLA